MLDGVQFTDRACHSGDVDPFGYGGGSRDDRPIVGRRAPELSLGERVAVEAYDSIICSIPSECREWQALHPTSPSVSTPATVIAWSRARATNAPKPPRRAVARGLPPRASY